MHEQRIGVAKRRYRQSLAGPDGDDMNVQAACRFEQGQDVTEQTGVLG